MFSKGRVLFVPVRSSLILQRRSAIGVSRKRRWCFCITSCIARIFIHHRQDAEYIFCSIFSHQHLLGSFIASVWTDLIELYISYMLHVQYNCMWHWIWGSVLIWTPAAGLEDKNSICSLRSSLSCHRALYSIRLVDPGSTGASIPRCSCTRRTNGRFCMHANENIMITGLELRLDLKM